MSPTNIDVLANERAHVNRATTDRWQQPSVFPSRKLQQIQGFSGYPDVIAHSFGTWLFAHLLIGELDREPADRLKFGRLILAGCVIRPDFDWQKLRANGLLEEVLNHYGTVDAIVPLAHSTIWDSGPSGRRGFDDHAVLNIRAMGYGHSDLFSVEPVVNENNPAPCEDADTAMTRLQHAYQFVWKPFLTLPPEEFGHIPNRANPAETWRPLPWLFCGTVFSVAVLPLCVAVMILFVTSLSYLLGEVQHVAKSVAVICGATLRLLLLGTFAIRLDRRFRYLTLVTFLVVTCYFEYFYGAIRALF